MSLLPVVVLAVPNSRMWRKLSVVHFLLILLLVLSAQPMTVANSFLLRVYYQNQRQRFPPPRSSRTLLTTATSRPNTTPKQIKNQKIHHVQKVSQKLFEFGNGARHDDDDTDDEANKPNVTRNTKILFIDGNNVRGISKFQTYNPVELTCHVEVLCHIYNIPNYVVVWDHGTYKYATIHNQDSARNIFTGLTLFSGMTQRADDIIVQEVQRLLLHQGFDSNTSGFSCCVVTNDSGLQFRLRDVSLIGRIGDSSSEDVAIEFFNRRRGRNLKEITRSITSNKNKDAGNEASQRPHGDEQSPPLLLIDSTNFVALLSSIDGDYTKSKSILPRGSTSTEVRRKLLSQSLQSNHDLQCAMNQVQDSMQEFSKQLQQHRKSSKGLVYKYNPGREKTWERCIQAEMLQRAYIARQCTSRIQETQSNDDEAEDDEQQLEDELSFGIEYLKDLVSRRYLTATAVSSSDISNAGTSSVDHDDQLVIEPTTRSRAMPGPARLDKRQKRLLQRFNAALQQGALPISDTETILK